MGKRSTTFLMGNAQALGNRDREDTETRGGGGRRIHRSPEKRGDPA
jgi:hypothetical protein